MPQAIPLIGLGLTAAGTIMSVSAASKSAHANADIARQEQANEALRQRAMELDARRKQMEVIRNQQRNNAIALAGATNQGASLGSGLQGGYGQISGESNTNAMGIQQNLEIGRGIFGNNQQISQDRINLAGFGSEAATGVGFSSFGSSLMSSFAPAKNLFGGNRNWSNPWNTGADQSYGAWVKGMGSNGIY